MGKLKIVNKSDSDDYIYNVIIYYERNKIDAMITYETEQLALVNTSIIEQNDKITEQEAIVTQKKLDAITAIDAYQLCVDANPMTAASCDTAEVSKANSELAKAQSKLRTLVNGLEILKDKKKRLETYIALLEDTPEAETEAILPCADLSVNIGDDLEVGSIDIFDFKNTTYERWIKPVNFNTHEYVAEEDGKIQATLANDRNGFVYNYLFLGATAAWRPIYRLATLTSIDDIYGYVEYDDLTDPRDVNYNGNEPEAPLTFNYMSCGARAFKVDDRVIVRYSGYLFENPEIIGFYDNPRGCNLEGICLTYSDAGLQSEGKYLLLDGGTFEEIEMTPTSDLYPTYASASDMWHNKTHVYGDGYISLSTPGNKYNCAFAITAYPSNASIMSEYKYSNVAVGSQLLMPPTPFLGTESAKTNIDLTMIVNLSGTARLFTANVATNPHYNAINPSVSFTYQDEIVLPMDGLTDGDFVTRHVGFLTGANNGYIALTYRGTEDNTLMIYDISVTATTISASLDTRSDNSYVYDMPELEDTSYSKQTDETSTYTETVDSFPANSFTCGAVIDGYTCDAGTVISASTTTTTHDVTENYDYTNSNTENLVLGIFDNNGSLGKIDVECDASVNHYYDYTYDADNLTVYTNNWTVFEDCGDNPPPDSVAMECLNSTDETEDTTTTQTTTYNRGFTADITYSMSLYNKTFDSTIDFSVDENFSRNYSFSGDYNEYTRWEYSAASGKTIVEHTVTDNTVTSDSATYDKTIDYTSVSYSIIYADSTVIIYEKLTVECIVTNNTSWTSDGTTDASTETIDTNNTITAELCVNDGGESVIKTRTYNYIDTANTIDDYTPDNTPVAGCGLSGLNDSCSNSASGQTIAESDNFGMSESVFTYLEIPADDTAHTDKILFALKSRTFYDAHDGDTFAGTHYSQFAQSLKVSTLGDDYIAMITTEGGLSMYGTEYDSESFYIFNGQLISDTGNTGLGIPAFDAVNSTFVA